MSKAPKPWKLTEEETFSSFTSWRHNLVYVLSCDDHFRPFLEVNWQKISADNETRGFTDDVADVANAQTAQQKVTRLNRMLGLISQWVPHYLASDIVNNSTSLESIWNCVRKYYGFQQSEVQFMKFSTIVWEEGERPERLYQRILAHLQDNMLTKDSKLKHDGVQVTKNEDISPTVERLAVLRWMELIHPSLPALVQRTFAYDLQRMTLKDLQPQIADALDGFLEELRSDDVKVSRVFRPVDRSRSSNPRGTFQYKRTDTRPKQYTKFTAKIPQTQSPKKECRICKSEGRRYIGHSLADCDYVSKAEKRSMIQSFRVSTADDDQHPSDDDENVGQALDELSLSEES